MTQYNAIGCLSGLACGDALGIPFEFWNKKKTRLYLSKEDLQMRPFRFGENSYPAGCYSDDTAQMICLGESLIENGFDVEDQFARYKRWFYDGYATADGRCFGIGQRTLQVLIGQKSIPHELTNDPRAGGNGALMRTAPIALYCHGDFSKIKEYSIRSAIVTHNNEIAAWSCVILNTVIFLIIQGSQKQDVLQKILELYPDIPEELKAVLETDFHTIQEEELPISGYSLDTLRIALWSFLETVSFADSVKKVILLGGDTDTFAAVTGAITGAYYGYEGIPEEWRKVINHQRIEEIAKRLSWPG